MNPGIPIHQPLSADAEMISADTIDSNATAGINPQPSKW